jgi:hypothetical protein
MTICAFILRVAISAKMCDTGFERFCHVFPQANQIITCCTFARVVLLALHVNIVFVVYCVNIVFTWYSALDIQMAY